MRPISNRTRFYLQNFLRRYISDSYYINSSYPECRFTTISVVVPFYPDKDTNIVPTFISGEIVLHAYSNSSTEIIIPRAEHGIMSFNSFNSVISHRAIRNGVYLWKILIKDNIYYIQPGLILDSDLTPLLIAMTDRKISGIYRDAYIMVHPKVFTQSGPVEKGIINTIIPVYTELSGSGNKAIISEDIENFISKPAAPKRDINKNIKEFLSTIPKETLDKIFT